MHISIECEIKSSGNTNIILPLSTSPHLKSSTRYALCLVPNLQLVDAIVNHGQSWISVVAQGLLFCQNELTGEPYFVAALQTLPLV